MDYGYYDQRGAWEVEKVLTWLPRAPSGFDSHFIRSLKQRLDRGLGLTDRQLEAIRNIISKFIERPVRRTETSRPPVQYYKLADPLSHYY